MNDQENKKKSYSDRERADKADFSLFNDFEEQGDYEEPDRDTDYTSIYREDGIEDEEFADTLFEEEDVSGPDDEDEWETPSSDVEFDESGAVEAADSPLLRERAQHNEPPIVSPQRDERQDDPTPSQPGESLPEDDDDWDDDEEYYADDAQLDERPSLPWGLIAVTGIALALLMAGGYGVIQQRSETQEEIRRLRAELATSVTSDQVAETREALEEAGQRNYQLQTTLEALNLENRRLSDTVAGLEAQLEAQRGALGQAPSAVQAQPAAGSEPEPEPAVTPAAPPTPVAQAEPTPAVAVEAEPISPAPAAPRPAEAAKAALGSGWFVNFASYGVEATAESWVAKLKPSTGRAIITMGTKNGRTFYRVRVVDLPNRESADRVAGELAAKHRLPKLWVGRQE